MDELRPHGGEAALETHTGSHDTFDNAKHRNWLVNGAGLGVYAHGRVHQQVGSLVFVGDLIHKRGYRLTDDILLMEEQDTLSYGEPLSVSSRMGDLVALAVMPTMSSANGEGNLMAYYEGGVVAFDTFQSPRETRHDGDGRVIQQGWDSRRLVNHLLNTVSAVGSNAVAILPRDHAFRSFRGIHFLSLTLGQESFRSENVNTVSTDVAPLLDADAPDLLHGSAVGFWPYGNRVMCTVGMRESEAVSALPYGPGIAVWNQAVTYTEDRTPVAAWEGVWTLDYNMAGIHKFVELSRRPNAESFGFVCSDNDAHVYTGKFDATLETDLRDDKEIPIEWALETAQFAPQGIAGAFHIKDLTIEGIFANSSQRVRISIRTDRNNEWEVWREFKACDLAKKAKHRLRVTESIGLPPLSHREATWVQVRVEGIGYAEIVLIDLDVSASTGKLGKRNCVAVSTVKPNYLALHDEPPSTRWK